MMGEADYTTLAFEKKCDDLVDAAGGG